MAPRLASSQLTMIRDMISSNTLTTLQMAKAAGCSKRSIKTISTVPTSDFLAMSEHLQFLAANRA
jgi:hypothetical protein